MSKRPGQRGSPPREDPRRERTERPKQAESPHSGRKPGHKPRQRHTERHEDGRATDTGRSAAKLGPRTGLRPSGNQRATPSTPAPPAVTSPMRIAKAMARAGLCSRRDAERWIVEGRVKVNGEVLASPARDVGPADKVMVDGQPLPGAEPPKLWRYHKPRGLVTTHRDPEGRPTVFEKLPPELGRVISIGRLDVTSEGLLLLTNDGALARHLELPATGWLRRYRVRAHGRITADALERLKDGVVVDGIEYGPVEATLDKEQGANVWLTVGLREGKNREVRKILAHLGLDVNRLIRISYGPFQLQDLATGATDMVRRRVLADQLGTVLARELGLLEASDADRARRLTHRAANRDGKGPEGGIETVGDSPKTSSQNPARRINPDRHALASAEEAPDAHRRWRLSGPPDRHSQG
ncbi:MAG: pseudouridine synthase [Hyphomicrobiaceae bacterium]